MGIRRAGSQRPREAGERGSEAGEVRRERRSPVLGRVGQRFRLSDRPDVTVVGGGVIGCAVAYELGRRGAAVRVLECRDVGLGATQASAGVLAPFIEAEQPGPLRELGVRSLELYDAFVEEVAGAGGADVPYERTGTLEVASDEMAVTRLVRAHEGLVAAGVDSHFLDSTETRQAGACRPAGAVAGICRRGRADGGAPSGRRPAWRIVSDVAGGEPYLGER